MSLLIFFNEDLYWKDQQSYFVVLLDDGSDFVGNDYLDLEKASAEDVAEVREAIPDERRAETASWSELHRSKKILEMNGKLMPEYQEYGQPVDVAERLGLKTGMDELRDDNFNFGEILKKGL